MTIRAKWRCKSMGSDPPGLTPVTAMLLAATFVPAIADPLKLEPGKPVALECRTKAVSVAENAAAATSGNVRLNLEPSPDASAAGGTWSVVSWDDAHKGAFAAREREPCAKGCPFRTSSKGEAQLWAPRAMSLEETETGQTLLIAVIKTDSLQLRASTFRGKDIEALEEGQCKVMP